MDDTFLCTSEWSHVFISVIQERWTDGGWTCNDEPEHFSLIPDLEQCVDVTKLSTSARESESLHVRVTGNQYRREKLTVRRTSVVPWEVVGDQVVKKGTQ